MNINGVFVMNWQSSWSFVNKQGVVDDDGTGWGICQSCIDYTTSKGLWVVIKEDILCSILVGFFLRALEESATFY